MTAYLKPGDKIFFVYPGSASPAMERDWGDSIKATFKKVGVETFGSMSIVGQQADFEIVAVLRDE